jgi:hypothetical protein
MICTEIKYRCQHGVGARYDTFVGPHADEEASHYLSSYSQVLVDKGYVVEFEMYEFPESKGS